MSASSSPDSGDILCLHHIPGFRSTRVVWLYHELSELYPKGTLPRLELVTYDNTPAFRVHKPPELLAINPSGKLPAMRHNDLTMFESCAIVHYLLDRFDSSGRLGSCTDPAYRAALYQFSFYVSGTVDNLSATSSPIQPVLGQDNLTPGDQADWRAMNRKAFEQLVGPILAKQLGERQFMFGDSFTALDVVIGFALVAILRKREEFIQGFPSLVKYAKNMRNRAAFKKAMLSQ